MPQYDADSYLGSSFVSADAIEFAQIYSSSNFLSRGIDNTATIFSDSFFLDSLSPFQSFFGIDSRQDENFIYVDKQSLLQLTANVNNKAESLFVGMINNLLTNTDDYSGQIRAFFWRANKDARKLQFVINCYFPVPIGEDGEIGEYSEDVTPMEM